MCWSQRSGRVCASYRLPQTVEKRTWRPVISPIIAFEYEAVLKRQIVETGMTAQDVDDFIEYLSSRARQVQIYFRWRPTLLDPGDHHILEVAVRTGLRLLRSRPGSLQVLVGSESRWSLPATVDRDWGIG